MEIRDGGVKFGVKGTPTFFINGELFEGERTYEAFQGSDRPAPLTRGGFCEGQGLKMKFTRLRLSGFKSFVEPTDLLIEPGLTGVVGPNGCGKSNLLEALRWVMGESSYKSMRASGMDDVIFSGTTERPARNMAEVLVTMSNDDGTAPPQYQDQEMLEISRRIERDSGSAYRINGKDVRARDVQLLFADVSTGSRSPALVRQGQIGEIINCEAAGAPADPRRGSGHHRASHAPPRGGTEAQGGRAEPDPPRRRDGAARNPAEQPEAPGAAGHEIQEPCRPRSAGWRRWASMSTGARRRKPPQRDAAALDEATRVLAEHTRAASEKLRLRDDLGEKLPGLREQEAIRAAVLQRVSHERNVLDEEERRAGERRKEFDQRIAQINSDLQREQELLNDTDRVLARLAEEDETLKAVARLRQRYPRRRPRWRCRMRPMRWPAPRRQPTRRQHASPNSPRGATPFSAPSTSTPRGLRALTASWPRRSARRNALMARYNGGRRWREACGRRRTRDRAGGRLRAVGGGCRSAGARRARRRNATAAAPMTKPAARPTACRRKSAH